VGFSEKIISMNFRKRFVSNGLLLTTMQSVEILEIV